VDADVMASRMVTAPVYHEPVELAQVIWREEAQVLIADAGLVSL
jgi:hypothetical protein